MHPSSPQAREMADESMVRNLSAQAEAIWPQEKPIFDRHPLGNKTVLDVGCGTGEIIARLAEAFPDASFVGVDLEEPHLSRARARCAQFESRALARDDRLRSGPKGIRVVASTGVDGAGLVTGVRSSAAGPYKQLRRVTTNALKAFAPLLC